MTPPNSAIRSCPAPVDRVFGHDERRGPALRLHDAGRVVDVLVGVAGERLAVAHAFAPREAGGLGLRRLVAQTAQDNAASNGVLTQAGFTVWGRESAADLLPNGRGNDALHWELLS